MHSGGKSNEKATRMFYPLSSVMLTWFGTTWPFVLTYLSDYFIHTAWEVSDWFDWYENALTYT